VGEFVDANTVKVGDRVLEGKHILIATGGRPQWPKNIPGSKHGISSDGFFELDKQPQRVAVVGAGYIAVELAGIMAALGSKTTLVIRHPTFLRTFDGDVVKVLDEEMSKSGVDIRRSANVERVTRDDSTGALTVTLRGGDTIVVDCLIWAIGREPNVSALHLDRAGVKQADDGTIAVDACQTTNVENIHAVGDVCGKWLLTPGTFGCMR
jgi:glutathione reductase (NADPH)